MYTVPLVILFIGIVLLVLNIYLFSTDYKYAIENKLKQYTVINIVSIVLSIIVIILSAYYAFIIYSQLV